MDEEDKQVAAAKGAEVEQEREMSRLYALCLFSLRRALTFFPPQFLRSFKNINTMLSKFKRRCAANATTGVNVTATEITGMFTALTLLHLLTTIGIPGKTFFHAGCGAGIFIVAAALAGAKAAFGFESPKCDIHGRSTVFSTILEHFKLNPLLCKIGFSDLLNVSSLVHWLPNVIFADWSDFRNEVQSHVSISPILSMHQP